MDYQKICKTILSSLPQRQQEVVSRRFGLVNGSKQETLQKIGDDFGITRERVRQIERDGFFSLREETKKNNELRNVFSNFEKHIRKNGGLKREDVLLSDLGGDGSKNQVAFLLALGDTFYRFPESEFFYSFWAIEQSILPKAKQLVNDTIKKFNKTKESIDYGVLFGSGSPNSEIFLSAVEACKQIEKGPLGGFGLAEWSEIKPRGVKDKAYLALKKVGKPMHFREIAKNANILQDNFFNNRKVLPQTAHNELIKDERFVLVGRGVYALTEWGYHSGTVKQVIAKVLKEAKKPMEKEKLLDLVLGQRMVKRNTILLNLQNNAEFLRDSKDRYKVKEV